MNKTTTTLIGLGLGAYIGFANAGNKCPKFPVLLQVCTAFTMPAAIAAGAIKGGTLAFIGSTIYQKLSEDTEPGKVNYQLATWSVVTGVAALSLYTPTPKPTSIPTALNETSQHSVTVSNLVDLFKNPASVGSRAICVAEGNCRISGEKTKFYKLHIDPGDHRVNGGYCSASAGRNPGTSHMTSLNQLQELCRRENQGDAKLIEREFRKVGLNPFDHLEAFVNAVDMGNQMHNRHAVRFVADYAKNPKMEMGLLRAKSSYLQLKGLHKACRNWSRDAKARVGINKVKNHTEKHRCVVADQTRRAEAIAKVLNNSKAFISPVPDGKFAYGFTKNHRGWDITAPVGTPVFAAHDGVVITSGWDDYGLGNVIEIENQQMQIMTVYAHNSKLIAKKGRVNQGDVIALVGSTGNSKAPHLHLETYQVNPNTTDPVRRYTIQNPAKYFPTL